MKKKKKYIVYFIIILCLSGIIYSTYNIIIWNVENKKNEKIINKLQEEIIVNEITENDDNENTELVNSNKQPKESLYWKYVKMNMIDVDFTELKKKNQDTKGWIQVGGTNINYPFVQAKDNKYYLYHSFEKKRTDAGWVFLDYRNDINNLGRNNIIYGHARLDKTMFGSLHNTLNKSWYNNKNNHIIKLSTETENTLWQVFSVYYIKTESYYITTSFRSDEDFQKYIDTALKRSIYNFNTTVTTDDKILTLSTCKSNNQKVVVQAKLIKKTKK